MRSRTHVRAYVCITLLILLTVLETSTEEIIRENVKGAIPSGDAKAGVGEDARAGAGHVTNQGAAAGAANVPKVNIQGAKNNEPDGVFGGGVGGLNNAAQAIGGDDKKNEVRATTPISATEGKVPGAEAGLGGKDQAAEEGTDQLHGNVGDHHPKHDQKVEHHEGDKRFGDVDHEPGHWEDPLDDPMFEADDPLPDEFNNEEHGGAEDWGDLDVFDFDPSEGLSFLVQGGKKECFFERVRDLKDVLRGAYISSSASAEIEFLVVAPSGKLLLHRSATKEGYYTVHVSETGIHEVCFSNERWGEDKLITHVTKRLASSHPLKKAKKQDEPDGERQTLAQYARDLDVKLGELESEQHLLEIRTDRHMKTQKSTNERVAWYGGVESFAYLAMSLAQVLYIKRLLNAPRLRVWA